MIEQERIRRLNQKPEKQGDFVLYWMQQSQRAHCNHALEFAAENANRLNLPLLTCFAVNEKYPSANLRHFAFMLQGLEETVATLAVRGIKTLLLRGETDGGITELSKRAALCVTDCGYMHHQREWRARLSDKVACALFQVESDVVVPLESASPKEEFAAYTLRPKILRILDRFMMPPKAVELHKSSLRLKTVFDAVNRTPLQLLADLDIDRSVPESAHFKGGYTHARERLQTFISRKLNNYDKLRNDPTCDYVSGLSPYLHFGQISPLEIALEVAATGHPAAEKFFDELIVRRELAMNFAHYNPHCDNIACLPGWAAQTLEQHANDPREHVYTRQDFEEARTHDRYWNAAQKEMMASGRMHGYMRMYWGKKILEWSATPAEAFRTAVYLNDRYELDGRDPNGCAGIAWCFGKHDRAWPERPVFGKVRYMNAAGLRRKFNADEYADNIEKLWQEYGK